MNISDIITPSRIEVNVPIHSKDELLEYMPGILKRNGDIEDLHEVRRIIFERENLMSTGIGHGIALPHGKTNAVKQTSAALVTLAEPIEYESLDNEPVQIVVILVGKEDQVSTHLKMLSKISRIVSGESFRNEAVHAKRPEEIHALLLRSELS